ncbi:MAG: TraB/GumN family protein [archaeon]|nr:TraB/GumN family protein [archaeon]
MTLEIIGTSHIAEQSIREIKNAILTKKPDIVAVELDTQRVAALLSGEQNRITFSSAFTIGIKGYLFAKIAQFVQQKLGKTVGVMPGSEMKAAIELARKEEIQIALIDQPIAVTLKNFSKEFTWRERFRFVGEILGGIFMPRRQIKKLGLESIDLSKVPTGEIVEKMMDQMKRRYPSVYKTIVEDRNKFMVRKLVRIMREHPEKNILAIVGAGHKKGMEELLLKVDVVR